MSHLLKATVSVNSLLNSGERLCRLCDREGNGARKYADMVSKEMNDLKGVAEQEGKAASQRCADYDGVRFADAELGDAIRSVFFTCRKHDWISGNELILEKVFPGSIFTPVVSVPWRRKAEIVTRTISRLNEVVAENGDLTIAAGELTASFEKFNAAREAYEKSVLEENRCRALERLARKEYADRYNFIYYKACGEIGRTNANRLFPVTQGGRKKTAIEEMEESELNNVA